MLAQEDIAAGNAIVDGAWAVVQRGGDVPDACRRGPSGTPIVLGGSRRGLFQRGVVALEVAAHLPEEDPRASECPIVADRLELGDRLGREIRSLRDSRFILHRTDACELGSRTELDSPVGRLDGCVDGLLEYGVRPGEVPSHSEHQPELARQLASHRLSPRKELDCPAKQVESGWSIGALPRSDSGVAETLAAGGGELACMVVRPRQLGQVVERLLVVVADELVSSVTAVEA